jgi:hypothetical protein
VKPQIVFEAAPAVREVEPTRAHGRGTRVPGGPGH